MNLKPYISIDVETTGLDPDTDMILEIAAVIDDWETPVDKLPTFHCYVNHGDMVVGSPFALSMHPTILRRIATKEEGFRYFEPDRVAAFFTAWLQERGLKPCEHHVTVAGKNFASFDRQFLKRLPHWEEYVKTQHRSIDPGNLYWNPRVDGRGLPSTKTCMERADLPGKVAHTAVEDALIVVKLIRRWLERLDEFNASLV